jgi:hypothetical protein
VEVFITCHQTNSTTQVTIIAINLYVSQNALILHFPKELSSGKFRISEPLKIVSIRQVRTFDMLLFFYGRELGCTVMLR